MIARSMMPAAGGALGLCLLGALMSGCVHLASVSTSSIPADRGQQVEASVSRFIFMGFNFDNDYVDGLAEDLASQCPGGRVRGVLTKHESVTYFLLFAHSVRVTATGFCVGAGEPPQ